MGRPKGSKNKPKDPNAPPKVKPVKEPKAAIPEPPKKVARTVLAPFEDAEPVPEKKKKEKDPNEETGPAYIPINMQNFVFTEHVLERHAHFLIANMDAEANSDLTKKAKAADEKITIFLIRKILKAIGYSQQKEDILMKEISEFKERPKPEQLYTRIRRR